MLGAHKNSGAEKRHCSFIQLRVYYEIESTKWTGNCLSFLFCRIILSIVMSATDRKLRVFLCHASQDKPIVRELYQRLLAEGWIDPWLDKEKLLPGQAWELEIEKSVEDADVVIVCLSKSSVAKEGYYQKEIKKVLDVADEKPEGTIFIIPLRLDNCQLPRRLSKWEYVDYFPVSYKPTGYGSLLGGLRSKLDMIIKRCEFCGDQISEKLTIKCKECGTFYHLKCWEKIGTCLICQSGESEMLM